ncbi:MAG: hypothetical protein ACKOSO_04845, partial [Actinomycetota bacterium]
MSAVVPDPAALAALLPHLRPPAVVLDPRELGTIRRTRHAFSRSLLRTAARERWTVATEVSELDADGRGTIIHRIEMGGVVCRAIVFSDVIAEEDRDDRVVATRWDAAIALVAGPIDADRRAELAANVPRQEDGRAPAGTLIWGRANRSARYFDYVVGRLAEGLQPEPDRVGDAAYLI